MAEKTARQAVGQSAGQSAEKTAGKAVKPSARRVRRAKSNGESDWRQAQLLFEAIARVMDESGAATRIRARAIEMHHDAVNEATETAEWGPGGRPSWADPDDV